MKITIVGSGFIGRSWAMLFASGGHSVVLFDISSAQLEAALIDIKNQMNAYKERGLLKGTLPVNEQCQLITTSDSLDDAVANASHIQECANEDLVLKTQLFEQLDSLISDSCTVASSTSTLPPSQFTANLRHKTQCLVAHPINPPYLMPLVELVMAPWTSADTVSSVRQLMTSVGQRPITLKKEVRGFIQPRLQYAAIQECLRLVRDGVMSVEDVDKVISHGLGLRYAFLGPFEVIHLNANGVRDYMQRYWQGLICDVLADEGPPMQLRTDDPCILEIDRQLKQHTPLDGLEQERKRRNELIGSFYKMSACFDEANQSQH